MFPKISYREMVKLVARYKGVKITPRWAWEVLSVLSLEDKYTTDGLSTEEHAVMQENNKRAIEQLNDNAVSSVRQLIDDNKELAKSIKVKMMDTVDERLELEPDSFTNDELIRGSKTFHEIELNMSENQVVNFNFLSPDAINETINKLRNKADGEREGIIEATGEVQEG